MDNILDKLSSAGVVPVVAVDDVDQALRLSETLSKGGLPVVEITFRSAAAAEAIQAVRENFPEMLVGAGTLIDTEHVRMSVDSGAHFGVAPGFNPSVVSVAQKSGLAFAPGVCTPSEVEQARDMNLFFFKLFPAEVSGGVRLLNALKGPYSNIKFMPTGGVTEALLPEYLALTNVVACGGTWIAPTELLRAKDFVEILKRTTSAVLTVSKVINNLSFRKV